MRYAPAGTEAQSHAFSLSLVDDNAIRGGRTRLRTIYRSRCLSTIDTYASGAETMGQKVAILSIAVDATGISAMRNAWTILLVMVG